MIELDPNSPPYAGEQLVADDSYLRRLPVALVTKERMRFDAVVTAADIITEAFGALRQFTAHAAVDLDKFSNGGRAFALSQCWAMVDQLHAIRQLLPAGGKRAGPFSQALIDAAQPATSLRNAMDHLAANLDNLSKQKGLKPPLFGSLSYFYAPNAEAVAEGGHIVTIMSGALHGADSFPIVNPLNREFTLPTGLFTLSGFGHELDYGHAIGALRNWLRRVEATIENDIRSKLVEHARSADQAEKAMATLGGGLTMIAAVSFDDEDAVSGK